MSERREIDSALEHHLHEISDDFGLSLELCQKGLGWAQRWKQLLVDYKFAENDTALLLRTARDAALDECPDIPRDNNDHPAFRAQFAAQQLLYRLMPDKADLYQTALEGDGLRVIPHFDKLDTITEVLLEARAAHEFPYTLEAANLPQDEHNMPPELPRGGQEHANFLWATCYYMRGGIKSTAAFAGLSEVYAEEPELFDPVIAMHDDPKRIQELLKSHGLAFSSSTIGPAWVENARRMTELYDGDPRNIFQYANRYEDVLFKIKNNGRGKGFIGFQEKMVSMITYYLMDSELIPYFDFPLPVDFHVLRVSAANEIITFENVPDSGDIYDERTLGMLRNMYHDFSVTHGVSQLDVCNAVWSLSSAICGSQPGNIMLEPGDRNKREGRSTHIVPLPIDLNSPSQIAMYERSCRLCPIQRTCKHNMPSKLYYVRGQAILSDRPIYESVDQQLFAGEALRRMTQKTPADRQHELSQLTSDKKALLAVEDEPLF